MDDAWRRGLAPAWLAELSSPLLTDLYQLTMLRSYIEHSMHAPAVFEFFVRRLPPSRGFLLAAGLEQALDYLETLKFGATDIDWLVAAGHADDAVARYLEDFRFSGDVYAVAEGTAMFADEPLLRVVAPLPEAQLVESRLVNLLNFQTVVASKAARCVLAARGRTLVDFGMRRAHGAEAGLLAARAAYLAGFDGTATVLASRLFRIPVYGTLAHSYIQAHDTEVAAFDAFARTHRRGVTLLIDTYDTLDGARNVVALLPTLRGAGIDVTGVRLDSGDFLELSRGVRAILDHGGARDIRIFASGGMNETEIERLLAAQAPIDGFGVGTDLDVSSDAPTLDCAYKLQEYAGIARRKRSSGKSTWPGRKQVYRLTDGQGRLAGDVIGLDTERIDGQPLLRQVMAGGQRIAGPFGLDDARRAAAESLDALPASLKALAADEPYAVRISRGVRSLAESVDARRR